jgi:hypothetical protein
VAKAPMRIPVGNLTSKLSRPFSAPGDGTVDNNRNTVSGETIKGLHGETVDTANGETVDTTNSGNRSDSLTLSATMPSPHRGAASLGAGNTGQPQTVNTETPREVKKQTSLALPWDVKKRLAIWRAQLRAEGLPATESGIVVALVRAATLQYARDVLVAPQPTEQEEER